jgi:primosomal protein N' (replication factor Y)
VVFGSATPRPEAWNALPRLTLPARADGSRLPAVEIVDMRTQGAGPVSRPLAAALHEAAMRGEKAVVLASRRGFSLMALCRECGWIARCPIADVALVQHSAPRRLACHHCGHEEPVPGICPVCASTDVVRQGTGSQGVEPRWRASCPGPAS